MALPAIAEILIGAGSSDLVKNLAEKGTVALIERITGVNVTDPNFDRLAADRLENAKLRAKLITEMQAMNLQSQRIATEFETVQITSEDKRVRNTRPLVMRVFAVLLAIVVLMAPYALWQEINYQKELFAKCFELENGNECFRQISERTSFVTSLLMIYGSALITTVAGGMITYMTVYAYRRSSEKIAGQDATVLPVPKILKSVTKKIKERARLTRRRPLGADNDSA